jgi:hypothetical protein
MPRPPHPLRESMCSSTGRWRQLPLKRARACRGERPRPLKGGINRNVWFYRRRRKTISLFGCITSKQPDGVCVAASTSVTSTLAASNAQRRCPTPNLWTPYGRAMMVGWHLGVALALACVDRQFQQFRLGGGLENFGGKLGAIVNFGDDGNSPHMHNRHPH